MWGARVIIFVGEPRRDLYSETIQSVLLINLNNLHTQIYGVLSVHVVRGRKHYHKQQATVVVVTKPVSFRLEL